MNNKPSYYYSNGQAKFYTEVDCDWWRRTCGDSQESPGSFRTINWTTLALLAGGYHFGETSHTYHSEILKQEVVTSFM